MSEPANSIAIADAPPAATDGMESPPRRGRGAKRGSAAVATAEPSTPEEPTAVEQLDDRIVIRFAPVAPNPYPPRPDLLQQLDASEAPQTIAEAPTGGTRFVEQPASAPAQSPRREGAVEPSGRGGEPEDGERQGMDEDRRSGRRRRRRGRGGREDGGFESFNDERRPQRRDDDAITDRSGYERPIEESAEAAAEQVVIGSEESGPPFEETLDREAGTEVGDERDSGDPQRGGRRRGRRGRGRRDDHRPGMREIEISGPGAEATGDSETEEILSERPTDDSGVEIGEAPRPRPEDEDYRFRRGRRGPRLREPREVIDVETADVGAEPPAEKRMIINVVPHEECRIGLLKDGLLEEIYIERASSENHVGNIYKGIVTNVEPSIQAAFVDFGIGKNGFLHISDLHPEYFGGSDNDRTENIGRKTPRRHRPPIQSCLRRGQEVIVQITKEGIGTKGPTLTTYVAIPGRFLVLSSGMQGFGVSRKIEDEEKRRSLRGMLNDLEPIPGMGVIARTAALGRTRQELQNDLNYLSRLWRAVLKRQKHDRAPCELYRESDLVIRTIRDVFTSDVKQIIIDDPDVSQRAKDFLSIFSPDSDQIVSLYEGDEPIFHKFGIENELERLHARHVPLRSGGSLVIDQTEALVAIDVNSGKFREQADSEDTAFRINMEAADEIPRQLRLRDLGGVVICDFIDMRDPGHRREIEHRLVRNLKAHKERAKILRMSSFGIIEMTRQRQRASLQRSVYQECTYCRGTGLVKTAESVALDVMRLIQLAATKETVSRIEVMTSLEVANMLQNRKRSQLHELEVTQRRTVIIHPEPNFGLDRIEMRCTDNRGRVIPHS